MVKFLLSMHDPAIVKDLTSFFQKAGAADIFHNDCDGITVLEENGKNIFFCRS